MAAPCATLVVALLAYLLGRSTLPLLVARRDAPRNVLQLELLLGNALLSVIGLLLAELGRFSLLRVVCIPALDSDRVLPAFQPLLSVWVAIFHALGGDHAMAAPITYFGALFLWTFASFAAGLAGPWTAALAVAMLASLVPQYWYSRFLMPEVPSQYFLWGGLWAGAVSLSSGGPRLGG